MSVFKLIDTSKLTAIGDAIREKKKTEDTFPVDDMPDAIMSIGDYTAYSGVYVVVPSPDNSIVLNTTEKVLTQDVTVTKIPFYEVSNNKGGTTVTIGKEVI